MIAIPSPFHSPDASDNDFRIPRTPTLANRTTNIESCRRPIVRVAGTHFFWHSCTPPHFLKFRISKFSVAAGFRVAVCQLSFTGAANESPLFPTRVHPGHRGQPTATRFSETPVSRNVGFPQRETSQPPRSTSHHVVAPAVANRNDPCLSRTGMIPFQRLADG